VKRTELTRRKLRFSEIDAVLMAGYYCFGHKKTPREKEVRKPGGLLKYVSCKA